MTPFRQWAGAVVLAALVCLAAIAPALAGAQCRQEPLTAIAFTKASALAVKVLAVLDASDARVAVIGRVGSDLSEYGMRYSHAGFVVRDHPKGRWQVVHLLNTCGSETSALYDEGLINFFLDDPFAYDSVIAYLPAALEDRLLAMLSSRQADALWHDRYSMIAYPFSTEYQNSNQWPLEVLGVALHGVDQGGIAVSRRTAQTYLRDLGYTPDMVPISPLKRLGASVTRANIAFFDHPVDERLSGRYSVVTVRSLLQFLEHRQSLRRRVRVALPGEQGAYPANGAGRPATGWASARMR
jgi:hypothetical protein